jgi:LPXTG-motif cell wall-anchored protein
MKRFFAALAATAALALLVTPSTAQAQQGSTQPSVGVQTGSGSITPGGSLPLSATGFCPGAVVTFRVGGSVATATASSTGVASVTVTAPATAGTYTVTAQSPAPCALTASGSIVVTSLPVPIPPGGLPATGSEPINWVRTGGIALLVGLGMVGAARLRRRTQVTAL